MMTAKQRYALSFTSGSLLTQEALIAAPIYLRERDWAATRARIKDENLLQTRVARSNTRMLGELIPRLQVLTDAELQIVADGTSTERGHLMWASACRRRPLPRIYGNIDCRRGCGVASFSCRNHAASKRRD